jgi:imidazolonepropionase
MQVSHSFIIDNISELITMAPLQKEQRFTRIVADDLGIIKDAWLEIADGKVAACGSGQPPGQKLGIPRIDAARQIVFPGFIDAHCHPIFAGNRAGEFAQKLAGKTYQQIAAAGGGIQSTVRATRNASTSELLELTQTRLQRFLRHGVTTVEAKSGYGLGLDHELRLLQVLRDAAQSTPQEISVTCLALHAVPFDAASKDQFIDQITNELLPEVKRKGLADWVDAFVETGYFTPADCDKYFTKAKDLGLGIRIHADEFLDSGAAAAAANWQAASADHLQMTSDEGAAAMAAAGVVAILLPGTSLYSKIPYTNAARFKAAGCPIAVATDFNPGSCVLDNISLAATLAAVHCGLSGSEALAAVTWVAARSLRLEHRKGALVPGFDADFSLFALGSADEWIADLGRTLPSAVYRRGNRAD